jgi:cysteine desulfuration protein SufE
MNNKTNTKLADIAEAFKETINEQEKLGVIIGLGEEVTQADRHTFTAADKVPGCVSDVYVHAHITETGTVHFTTFTASLIIKGYVAILFAALQDQKPATILQSEKIIKKFLEETKIELISVVPSRTNSFSRLYEHMKKKTEELSIKKIKKIKK